MCLKSGSSNQGPLIEVHMIAKRLLQHTFVDVYNSFIVSKAVPFDEVLVQLKLN